MNQKFDLIKFKQLTKRNEELNAPKASPHPDPPQHNKLNKKKNVQIKIHTI